MFGISEGSPSLIVLHVGTSHGVLNFTRRPTKRSEEVPEKAPRDSRIDWAKFYCSQWSNLPYSPFLVARSEVEGSSYRCTSKSQLLRGLHFKMFAIWISVAPIIPKRFLNDSWTIPERCSKVPRGSDADFMGCTEKGNVVHSQPPCILFIYIYIYIYIYSLLSNSCTLILNRAFEIRALPAPLWMMLRVWKGERERARIRTCEYIIYRNGGTWHMNK